MVVDDIMQIDTFNSIMEQYGYNARGENGITGRRYFVKLNPDNMDIHTHPVHIYQKENPHLSDELIYRDYLRINNEALKEYESVKKEASLNFVIVPRNM